MSADLINTIGAVAVAVIATAMGAAVFIIAALKD